MPYAKSCSSCESHSLFWSTLVYFLIWSMLYWSMVLQESATGSSFLLTVAKVLTRKFFLFDCFNAQLWFGLQLWTVKATGTSCGLVFTDPLEASHTHKEILLVSIISWPFLNVRNMHAFSLHTDLLRKDLNTDVTVGTISIYPLFMTLLREQLWLEALCFWVDYLSVHFLWRRCFIPGTLCWNLFKFGTR